MGMKTDFSVKALLMSDVGEAGLKEWVLQFLSVTENYNQQLIDIVKNESSIWRGATKINNHYLHCRYGHEIQCESLSERELRVEHLRLAYEEDFLALPPMIVLYRKGVHDIADGSHRHEAMMRLGENYGWALISYTDEYNYHNDVLFK